MKYLFNNLFKQLLGKFDSKNNSIKNIPKRVLIIFSLCQIIVFNACTTDRIIEISEYDMDTDGDGILDSEEALAGTDKNNPCDPAHGPSYNNFDSLNLLWLSGDCDTDGIKNEHELLAQTNPYGEPIKTGNLPVAEFLDNLSQLQLFKENIADLQPNTNVYPYEMITPLFTDYAYKFRVVALPEGTPMEYDGGGLLLFPDNTILAKTFYYLNDERNPSLGKRIIETRILIKKDGIWKVGNYVWNNEQTDAQLDAQPHSFNLDWIDALGNNREVNYKVPSTVQCAQCHTLNGGIVPVGPKARALNFVHNGNNQLQGFVDQGLLGGAPAVSQIPVLPDWSDVNASIEERARAYLDVNCAHCHQNGGSYNVSFGNTFQFTYETPYEESNISLKKVVIMDRMSTEIPGYFMPLIGTSLVHDEGVALITDYLNSLD